VTPQSLFVDRFPLHLSLDNSFAWLGTPFALTMLAAAALVEVLAYYVPGVDNVLDAVATPAAIAAGTIVSAAVMTDLPPMVKWIAAVVAGGGAAGFTQGVTAMLRAKSTAFTGGFGNPVIATGELGDSGGATRCIRGGHLAIVARASSDPAAASGNAAVPASPLKIGPQE
jgi:hypothetical protein